LLT
ncbi:hflK protein, partial [Vibrio parahaemolyticus V-223/04]|jgi:NO-binding membrane sensor protein with MHYT domain